uniref:Uncharacterized protein n=1 Tax=Meloidogyne hapla TaxID=6305 RepID=A0A1I8BKK8_MELHA
MSFILFKFSIELEIYSKSKIILEQWPWLLLRFNFHSSKWQKALICGYLPSLMLFACALLAQWKRRKIQIFVLIGVIISLILLQNIHYQLSKNISFNFSTKLNLMDLWIAGIFVHLICLVSIDLAFPARRVIIFKQKIMRKRSFKNNNIPIESREIDNELIVSKGERSQRRRIIINNLNNSISPNNYSSPLLSTFSRKIGAQQQKFPKSIGRQLRSTFFPSSSSPNNSLLHHYVSSPRLSGNQQKQQKSPLLLNSKRRIISVLPNSISSSPSSPYNSTKGITSYNQMIRTSSVPPFKASSSSANMDNNTKSWPEGEEDINDERRQQAITQLLNEMERIRNNNDGVNCDEESFQTNKYIQSFYQQQPPSLPINQQKQEFLRVPPPPPPSQPPNVTQYLQQQQRQYSFKYPQNSTNQYKIGKVQQFSGDDDEEEEELGRIEGGGLGMPRQK